MLYIFVDKNVQQKLEFPHLQHIRQRLDANVTDTLG